jgi:hypothetical protein
LLRPLLLLLLLQLLLHLCLLVLLIWCRPHRVDYGPAVPLCQRLTPGTNSTGPRRPYIRRPMLPPTAAAAAAAAEALQRPHL